MRITLVCATCEQEFQHDAQGGFRPVRCPPCALARRRELNRAKAKRWREANPERNREQQNKSNRKRLAQPEHRKWKRENEVRRIYGLTPADFAALLEKQGGVCAICGGPPNGPGRRLHVDHCHTSKAVRGLLCAKCNTAVGLLDDDPDRLDKAAAYLRSHM